MQAPLNTYFDLPDSTLVEHCKAGEHRAFEILVARWQESTYRLAWRYLGSVEESMDTTQNTFIKAWTSLQGLDSPTKFGPWVHQICRNQCLDYLRSSHFKRIAVVRSHQSNYSSADDEASMETLMHLIEQDTPHSELVRSQRIQIVHTALSTLPEEQKIVVMLKELEGLKFREISEQLNLSENTVKSRLYYGLSALRKYFSNHNLEQEVKTA
jgi:RNA polymerase sigma-70 factor, ECF subfamily